MIKRFFILLLVALNSANAVNYQFFYIPAHTRMITHPYNTSMTNLSLLSTIKEKGIKFSLQNKSNSNQTTEDMMCRGWFPIATEKSEKFTTVIENAFRHELSDSNLLNDSNGTVLMIEDINASFTTAGESEWMYSITLSNQKQKETFSYTHDVGLYVVAVNACHAIGEDFSIGLEAFLKSIYTDPRFLSLLQ